MPIILEYKRGAPHLPCSYDPSTSTAMQNAYSITSLRIVKDTFSMCIFPPSQVIVSTMLPYFDMKTKINSELKVTPFSQKQGATIPFCLKTRTIQDLIYPPFPETEITTFYKPYSPTKLVTGTTICRPMFSTAPL